MNTNPKPATQLEKIEDVRKETRSVMRHSQIMTASVVTIALGVLYAIIFK